MTELAGLDVLTVSHAGSAWSADALAVTAVSKHRQEAEATGACRPAQMGRLAISYIQVRYSTGLMQIDQI